MRKLGGVSGFRAFALGAGWLVCCAALVGCDGETDDDDDEGGPSSAPVGADDFAARFAARYCGSIGACCERFDEAFDLGDCTTLTESYLRAALATQLETLKVAFDEGLAGRCIDEYGAALAACTDPEKVNAVDSCDRLIHGTVPLGEACTEGIECVRSAAERVTCSSGVCTLEEDYYSLYDVPHAALGEPCVGTCDYTEFEGGSCSGSATSSADEACWVQDGLVCSGGVCATAPVLGEACTDYCGDDSHCSGAVCVAAIATGPCPRGDECAVTSFCNYDASPAHCEPKKPDGAACDSEEECLGGGCEGDQCRKWSVATRESCAGIID
jgi:hypothetical protein